MARAYGNGLRARSATSHAGIHVRHRSNARLNAAPQSPQSVAENTTRQDERCTQLSRDVDLAEVQIVARECERGQAGEHDGRNHDAVRATLKIACQLLNREDDAGKRRVERHRQARRRAG
jgi:hypothetical protein